MLFNNIFELVDYDSLFYLFLVFVIKKSSSFDSCCPIVSRRIHLIKAPCVAVNGGLSLPTLLRRLASSLCPADSFLSMTVCAVNTVSRYLFIVHCRVLFQILLVTFADRYH